MYLATINGWSYGKTHTENPHGYIRSIEIELENSSNPFDQYGSAIRLRFEIAHQLGIDWFCSGRYDEERHERYDLGLSTVLRLTVDPVMCQIIAIEWADPWKRTYWRDVAIPSETLQKYRDLVLRKMRWERSDLSAHGIPQNALLFARKVRFLDRKVMEIRLESGEDDVWLCGRMLDRGGKELTRDYFRGFPGVFSMLVGDTRYEAMVREIKPQSRSADQGEL